MFSCLSSVILRFHSLSLYRLCLLFFRFIFLTFLYSSVFSFVCLFLFSFVFLCPFFSFYLFYSPSPLPPFLFLSSLFFLPSSIAFFLFYCLPFASYIDFLTSFSLLPSTSSPLVLLSLLLLLHDCFYSLFLFIFFFPPLSFLILLPSRRLSFPFRFVNLVTSHLWSQIRLSSFLAFLSYFLSFTSLSSSSYKVCKILFFLPRFFFSPFVFSFHNYLLLS